MNDVGGQVIVGIDDTKVTVITRAQRLRDVAVRYLAVDQVAAEYAKQNDVAENIRETIQWLKEMEI